MMQHFPWTACWVMTETAQSNFLIAEPAPVCLVDIVQRGSSQTSPAYLREVGPVTTESLAEFGRLLFRVGNSAYAEVLATKHPELSESLWFTYNGAPPSQAIARRDCSIQNPSVLGGVVQTVTPVGWCCRYVQ
jgi:hypothetical protein